MIKASHWFTPKWKHADAAVRASAVANSEDPALLAALADIARSDTDAGVRLAALQRADDNSLLHSALATERNEHNRQWILTHLLMQHQQRANSDASSREQLTALLDTLTDTAPNQNWAAGQIEALASKAKDRQVRQLALQRISRQGLLGDLCCREPDPGLQAAILARIDQTSTLERISKNLRKRNKTLYQACQQRLAELGDDTAQAEHSAARAAEALLSEVELLLHGKRAPLQAIHGQASLSQTLQQAQQRWQQLSGEIDGNSDAGQALQRRWDNAMQILQQAAAARPAASTAPAQDNTARDADSEAAGHDSAQHVADSEPDQPQPALQKLAAELDTLLQQRHRQLDSLRQALQPWRQRWRAQWQHLDHISRADQRLQDQLINRIQASEDRLNDRQAQQQLDLSALLQLLQQALSQAADGKLHDANSSQTALNEALQQAGAAAKKSFQQQQGSELRTLQGKLAELRQWQRWSDNQQRQRLLADLRAAKDSELNADALVSLVKDARQQWQQLERSEVLAGMRPLGSQHALNRQFQGICGMLMRSAKPFLQKRDVLRHERGKLIEERLQVCEQLLASSEVRLQQLLQQKRLIGQSFKEIGNVAADQRKALLAALRQHQQALQERIQSLTAAAELHKRRLIRLAEQLPHEADQAAALQQAKALQREWQQQALLPRKLEQSLWQSFRAPMDELFAAQDAQRQQQQAEQQAQREQQQQIVTELEALLQKPDQELTDQRARCEDLQHQFSLLQRPDRALQQRLRQAADQFEQRLQQAIQQRRQAAWQAADSQAKQQQRAASERLQALLAGSDSSASSDSEADALPAALQQLSASALQAQLQQQSESARAVCIAAEFIAGLPSPEQDQQQRMQYQVDRLSQHLRDKQQSSPGQQLRQVRQNWYACMPMHPDDYTTLQARFDRAIAAAEKILTG